MKTENGGKYYVQISVDESELNSILQKLEEAKEQIYECYARLGEIGIISIKSQTAPRVAAGGADPDQEL